MALHVVILAAGQGTRMCSSLPKVLHKLAHKPMLQWVLDAAQCLHPEAIHVVVGHQRNAIMGAFTHPLIHWVEQKETLGTGHAVLQALPSIPMDAQVLILCADVPLLSVDLLQQLAQLAKDSPKNALLHLLTAELTQPYGLGRIVRDAQKNIVAIVEEKDASAAQKDIKEIYSGICLVKASALHRWLPNLKSNNAQREFYLTEIIAMAVAEGSMVNAVCTQDVHCISGVNTRAQLQTLERHWQQKQAQQLMLQGVTLADAQRFDLRGTLHCSQDVYIDINVIIEGHVEIEEGCRIGANTILRNCRIASNTHIHPFSSIDGATIGTDCSIGPFARLREGTVLDKDCKIGNFVEVKKTQFGAHSKASHLSYLGDSIIGEKVNIGAGTITCNYDGANKHQTVIEDGAFIGSDTQLVAPVRIGKNATIGAGSTIRKDAPAEQLSLSKHSQISIPGWKRPLKNT